ncbi:BTAD domain-containing putative transcriptional regulator [Actinomadura vinacea]|uniref:BTAD domain-containing putative transcriptional regulator n=1 Tax=Actinomadura vinacea TaxID=115336 RepID=A0ABP5XMB3_9ACTN
MDDDALEFRLLGPLEVVRGGREVPLPSGRQRTLLACLLLSAGRPVPVSTLVDRLWDAAPPRDARGTLQVHLVRLRRALADVEVVRTRPGGYLVDTVPDDLRRLGTLEARADRARKDGDLDGALRSLRAATSLWRGPILSNVASSSLHAEETPRLTERCLKAVERRYEVELALGHHEAAIAELRTLAAAHPLREALHGLLMRALYRAGRQAEALEAYDRAAAALTEDFGLDPGDGLKGLRQAILTRTEDEHSAVLAPGAAVLARETPVPWRALCQLPSPAGDFTGRAEALAEVELLLWPGGFAVPIVTVSGSAGVGKTALAVRAAHRLRERFPDAQLYARLGVRDPAEIAGDLLRALGVPPEAVPDGAQARGAALRARLTGRRVLLVLDDATAAAQVEALLPGTGTCAVLVTSRRMLAELPGNRVLRLAPLTPDDADAFLRRMVGAGRVAAEPAAAHEITAACGRLPLALRIAGARLATRPSLGLAAFARRLRIRERRLDELSLGGLEVRAGLRAGYDALDDRAAAAFRGLGLVGRADVTAWLLASLAGRDQDRELETLVGSGLLEPAGTGPAGEPRYRLHDLTADFAAEVAGPPGRPGNRAALGRLVDALTALAGHAREATARSSNDLPAEEPAGVAPVTAGDLPPGFGDGGSGASSVARAPITWLAAHRSLIGDVVVQACAAGSYERAARLVDLVVPLLHRQVDAAALRRLRETVRDAARDAGHERIRWREEYGLAVLALYTGPPGETIEAARACAAAFERFAMHREMAYAFGLLTFVGVRANGGDGGPAGPSALTEFSALAERAVPLARRSGDPLAEVVALTAKVDALAAAERFAEALAVARAALRLARTLGEPHFEATALSRVTHCELELGDAVAAARACGEALRLLDGVQDRRSAAWLLRESARITLVQGRREEAAELAERAVAHFRDLGDRYGQAEAAATLAGIRLTAPAP